MTMANTSVIYDLDVAFTTITDMQTTMTSNSTTESDTDGCNAHAGSAKEEMEDMIGVQYGIAILATLSACSVLTIAMFLHSMIRVRRNVPYGNRRMFLVRLTGLFPIFSITSLAGFFVPKASMISKWGASLYLSTTLYIFVLLIVDYYGGIEAMEHHLETVTVSLAAMPLTCCCPCLPKIHFSLKNFHRFRRLVLQTAYVRPICVFLGAVLWADGTYQPVLKADSAFLYLNVISLISTLFGVYGLSIVYNATEPQLHPFMIGVQFATIKSVLIVTNVQNFIIAVLVLVDVIPCVGPFDSAVRGELIYNMLVVVEMFIMALFFKFYYWRWMIDHEYGKHIAARASVGDILGNDGDGFVAAVDDRRLDVGHVELQPLHDKSDEDGSQYSGVVKNGSSGFETIV